MTPEGRAQKLVDEELSDVIVIETVDDARRYVVRRITEVIHDAELDVAERAARMMQNA